MSSSSSASLLQVVHNYSDSDEAPGDGEHAAPTASASQPLINPHIQNKVHSWFHQLESKNIRTNDVLALNRHMKNPRIFDRCLSQLSIPKEHLNGEYAIMIANERFVFPNEAFYDSIDERQKQRQEDSLRKASEQKLHQDSGRSIAFTRGDGNRSSRYE